MALIDILNKSPEEMTEEEKQTLRNRVKKQQVSAPEGRGPVASAEEYAAQFGQPESGELASSPGKTEEEVPSEEKPYRFQLPGLEKRQERKDVTDKEAREQAYKMYEDEKKRNEWLELAQILGRAGVQLVAAQGSQGKYGRDYSNIPMGPGVDYGARTAASQRMLESRLRDVERGELLRERAQDAAEREADRRERLGLERARLQMEAGRPEKKSPEEMLNLRESLLQKRQEEAESRKEQAAKEKAMESAIGAQQILASGDATNKQKDKARETLATSAAQAGIDLDKLEEQSMVPGKLWGQNLDEKKKLANLRAALDELRAGRSRQSAPQSGSMPQGGGMVTVTHKATGQSKQFPAGSPEAQRAQQDPEFEVK